MWSGSDLFSNPPPDSVEAVALVTLGEAIESMIAHLPVGLVVLSGDLEVQLANPAFREQFGFGGEALQGWPINQLFLSTGIDEIFAESLESGRPLDGYSLDVRTSGGSLRPVRVSALPLGKAQLAVFVEDLEVEEELRSQLFDLEIRLTAATQPRSKQAAELDERSCRSLVDASHQPALVCRAGGLVQPNATLARRLGLEDGRDPGWLPASTLLADPAIVDSLVSGSAADYEGRVRLDLLDLRGRPVPIDAVAIRLIVDEHEGAIIFGDCIEEDSRLVDVIRWIARAAHRINNPLTCVSANLEYIHEELKELSSRLESETGTGAGVPVPVSKILREMLDAVEATREAAAEVKEVTRELTSLARRTG